MWLLFGSKPWYTLILSVCHNLYMKMCLIGLFALEFPFIIKQIWSTWILAIFYIFTVTRVYRSPLNELVLNIWLYMYLFNLRLFLVHWIFKILHKLNLKISNSLSSTEQPVGIKSYLPVTEIWPKKVIFESSSGYAVKHDT